MFTCLFSNGRTSMLWFLKRLTPQVLLLSTSTTVANAQVNPLRPFHLNQLMCTIQVETSDEMAWDHHYK